MRTLSNILLEKLHISKNTKLYDEKYVDLKNAIEKYILIHTSLKSNDFNIKIDDNIDRNGHDIFIDIKFNLNISKYRRPLNKSENLFDNILSVIYDNIEKGYLYIRGSDEEKLFSYTFYK